MALLFVSWGTWVDIFDFLFGWLKSRRLTQVHHHSIFTSNGGTQAEAAGYLLA
jgi:hypothetical protein